MHTARMYNNKHANYSKNITINKKTTLKLYNKVYYTFFWHLINVKTRIPFVVRIQVGNHVQG